MHQGASGVNEAGYNTSSFFDSDGNVLPVASVIAGKDALPAKNQ